MISLNQSQITGSTAAEQKIIEIDPENIVAAVHLDLTQAACLFDPTGKAKSVGTTVKLDLELPGTVLALGMLPTNIRGVEAEKDKNKVSVWLPLRALRQEGEDLFLGVNWR